MLTKASSATLRTSRGSQNTASSSSGAGAASRCVPGGTPPWDAPCGTRRECPHAALDVVLNLPLRRVRMLRQVLADTPAPLLRRVARVSGGSGLGQWPAAAAPQMVRGRTPRSLCSNQSRCCWSCPRASSSAWRITSISSSASRSTSAAESRLSRKQLLETLAQSVKQSHDHRRSIRRRGELRNQVAGARQGDLIQRDSRST
jgi:hypothetical protein